jgi:hypothetical protein
LWQIVLTMTDERTAIAQTYAVISCRSSSRSPSIVVVWKKTTLLQPTASDLVLNGANKDAHQIIFIADVTRGWGAQLLFQLDSLLVFTSPKIMDFTASNSIFLNVWRNVENPLVPSVLHTRVCT